MIRGILRIDFPGYSGSGSLEEISWEEFFEKFDREKLALVYQDTTARGQKSNFNKIVSRESVTDAPPASAAQPANPAARRHGESKNRPQKPAKAGASRAAPVTVRDLNVGIRP